VHAFVSSLERARDAAATSQQASQRFEGGLRADPASAITDFSYQMKVVAAEYQCAALMVKGFTSNEDEVVRVIAKSADAAYVGLQSNNEELRGEFQRFLDSTGPIRQGEQAQRLADLAFRKDELRKSLLLVTAATAGALVQVTGRLALTRGQRRDLATRIKQAFPGASAGLQTGQAPEAGAAALLYVFISDAKWKSADDP
jgi:hypothetical protein